MVLLHWGTSDEDPCERDCVCAGFLESRATHNEFESIMIHHMQLYKAGRHLSSDTYTLESHRD